MEITQNAQRLLETRYFLPGENWEGLLSRVANHAAPDNPERNGLYKNVIGSGLFIPSRMPYMGTPKPFCSSCFVLGPINDSRESIFSVLSDMAEVQAYGGGTGYNFSRLRPEGDKISTTRGSASGPVSFMQLYNSVTKCITRNGNKGGAQMGILDVGHPDILKFLSMKEKETDMVNFNISVNLSDDFMHSVVNDLVWSLRFGDKVYSTIPARELMRYIASRAWKNGEPGVIFLDTINRHNQFGVVIEATNACSEQPLPGYTSCNLGSINLATMVDFNVDGSTFNWGKFNYAIKSGVYFLNDSINSGWWPIEKLKENTLRYRNIGLGVMGYADMLALMGIPYHSDRGVEFTAKLVMEFRNMSDLASWEYTHETGYTKNTTVTTVAPTGSISMLANVSSAIEPFFGLTYVKNTTMGKMAGVNPVLSKVLEANGIDEDTIREQLTSGTITETSLPDKIKQLFLTGNEIPWQRHLEVQSMWQAGVDSAVSKTINMPYSATVEDVERAFITAWRNGCKSTTVYRNGSRSVEAIVSGTKKNVLSLETVGLKMNVPSDIKQGECISCTV